MNIKNCVCGHTSLHHQRDSMKRMGCIKCDYCHEFRREGLDDNGNVIGGLEHLFIDEPTDCGFR